MLSYLCMNVEPISPDSSSQSEENVYFEKINNQALVFFYLEIDVTKLDSAQQVVHTCARESCGMNYLYKMMKKLNDIRLLAIVFQLL